MAGVGGEAATLQMQRSSWNQQSSFGRKSGFNDNEIQRQITEWFRTPKERRCHVMEQPIIKEDDRPLYHAARLGDVEQVDALIERGIHADERDEYGRSPLHYAAWNGSLPVVKRLMKDGADCHARTFDGVSPADCAYKMGQLATGHYLALQEMGLSEAQITYKFQAEGLGNNINTAEDKHRLTMVYYKKTTALSAAGGPTTNSSFKQRNEIVPKDAPIAPKRTASSRQLPAASSFKAGNIKNLDEEARELLGPAALMQKSDSMKRTSPTAKAQSPTAKAQSPTATSPSFSLKPDSPTRASEQYLMPDNITAELSRTASSKMARTKSGGANLTRGSSGKNLVRTDSAAKTTRVKASE